MILLVHGIADAEAAAALAPDALGAARGQAVEVVADEHTALAAFTTHVEGDEVLPTRALLMGHARLLAEVARTTTVLPLRFGTTVPTIEDVRTGILAGQGEKLRDVLGRLRGHVELRLRGRYDEQQALREIARGDRAVARLRGRADAASRIELGERVVAALEARRSAVERRVVDALDAHVSETEVEAVREPLDVFSIAALVRDPGAFEARVEDLAGELAPLITLELVGPHPPYSFVGGGEAWDS